MNGGVLNIRTEYGPIHPGVGCKLNDNYAVSPELHIKGPITLRPQAVVTVVVCFSLTGATGIMILNPSTHFFRAKYDVNDRTIAIVYSEGNRSLTLVN
jgi:hypothetical protein